MTNLIFFFNKYRNIFYSSDSLNNCNVNITANPTKMANNCHTPLCLLLLSLANTSKKTTYNKVPAAIPCKTTDVTSSSERPVSLNNIPIPIPTI